MSPDVFLWSHHPWALRKTLAVECSRFQDLSVGRLATFKVVNLLGYKSWLNHGGLARQQARNRVPPSGDYCVYEVYATRTHKRKGITAIASVQGGWSHVLCTGLFKNCEELGESRKNLRKHAQYNTGKLSPWD